MKVLRLLWLFFATEMSSICAQDSCLFYVYETKFIFSDLLQANEFEKEALEDGLRNLYIRLNDTTFLDSYKLILKTAGDKRRWFFNATQNVEPISCDLFREDTIYDGFLSYNEIQIDIPESHILSSKNFAFQIKKDSIFIVLENNKSYLKYSTKNDTIHGIKGSLELTSYKEWFHSLFLKEEPQLFFGDSITTLVFKEIYSNREEIIWFHKQKMIPTKIKIVFPGNIHYHDIKLIAIYQY